MLGNGVDPNYVYTMPDGTEMDGTYVYAEWTYTDSDELDLSISNRNRIYCC
ncbi:MAG: hypothetical protein ACLRQF_22670 [Thomasclavelia ramosa]